MTRSVASPIVIVGTPSSAGAYAPGQELAPAALRDADLIGSLRRAGHEVTDRGDLPAFRWRVDPESPRARNPAAVAATIEGVRDEVGAALADGPDVRALVLGGDCTTGLGAIAALARIDPESGVVYLDLHADMNTPDSVIDGALDWMGLAHALDLPGTVREVSSLCALAPEQLVLTGYRAASATEFERGQVAALGVAAVTDAQLTGDPAGAAARALARLEGRRSLAVHFDVDVIDFGEVPLSENTGANQGVPFDAALAALTALMADARVRTLTVTEHNPLHGAPDGSDTRRLADALAAAAGP